MGKLIAIEGSDGSGKATQAKMLYNKLLEEGKNVILLEYPDYKSDSSALVKMYLAGEFGKNTFDVNAYTSASFYAVDRIASYMKYWKDFYNESENNIVICDRYTTSNKLHNAVKLKTIEERLDFFDWVDDLEHNKLGLPYPDIVIFLAVEPAISIKLIEDRKNKITNKDKKDINEVNKEFLRLSYENGLILCSRYSNWNKIECIDVKGNLKPSEEIHKDILFKIHRDII